MRKAVALLQKILHAETATTTAAAVKLEAEVLAVSPISVAAASNIDSPDVDLTACYIAIQPNCQI